MALFTDLEIFKTTLKLVTLCTKYVATMDKNYRGTIGADMRRDCREVIQRIQLANSRSGKERIEQIEALRWAVGQIEVAVRICVDPEVRALSPTHQARLIPLTVSIGKQATGWKQQTENALARQVATVARPMRY
ncbi:four helix bundle protein [Candidimonas humi]|uniref:Four helix bundle protein n=1 Tax=Candidimonas humi TaxID=683355 RepID=A0ABV8NXY4_9BURK|nr:four helix bundle protein [Candidimonas humi]MBV6304898.1 four helix bundle protein [Candidimonas humi]